MGSPQVIAWMIAGCAAFILFLFFYKLFIKILQFLFKGALWGIGFLVCNALLSAVGISAAVGINAVTILVAVVLGIPGFLLLYLIQLILP